MPESYDNYCKNCGRLLVGEDTSFCKHCNEFVKKGGNRWFIAS